MRPIRAGQLRNGYVIAVMRALENFMYRKARHITVISPSMLENLIGKGVEKEKISIIPNFVDTDFIRPLPRQNEFARQFGLVDKFVVTHAGNIGYVYDFETLLEAASLVRTEAKIFFLIVGNGVARSELERKTRELELENVRFIPFQPHAMLPWLRASSDVQVNLYKDGAANDSFPSKVYEIMASGRPLLASAEPESGFAALVKEADCGICITPGRPRELADAILKLYNEPLHAPRWASAVASMRNSIFRCRSQWRDMTSY